MHVCFQEKVDSVATSVQLRSQIQVTVQLSADTEQEVDFSCSLRHKQADWSRWNCLVMINMNKNDTDN